MKSKQYVAVAGIFAAAAILIGYLESLVPLPLPVPGIKLGLANIAVLAALYWMDAKTAAAVMLVKVLACGLLFSGLSALLYSLAGAVLALIAMLWGRRVFSVIGNSIFGSVAHISGQMLVAALVLQSPSLVYYWAVLLLFSLASGALTGLVAASALRLLPKR